jgi:hypothetical protein
MNSDESRKLKPGTRVCYNGDLADLGTVTATEMLGAGRCGAAGVGT